MPYFASYWVEKANKLILSLDKTKFPQRGAFPKACEQQDCLVCHRRFSTFEEKQQNLDFYRDGTLRTVGRSRDLRTTGFHRLWAMLPLFLNTYQPSVIASKCRLDRDSYTFQTCRMMMVYSIGAYIMSPRPQGDFCSAPGVKLCREAATVHTLAVLKQHHKIDGITNILFLAYYTLVGNEQGIITQVQLLESEWSAMSLIEPEGIMPDYIHWTLYGFLYYLSETKDFDMGLQILGRAIQLKEYEPRTFAIDFRTQLFALQTNKEFGTRENLYHREAELQCLLTKRGELFSDSSGNHLLSFPLMLEWHLTYLFSGWELLEQFLRGLCRPRRSSVKVLQVMQQCLDALISERLKDTVRTSAVFFCQTYRETWSSLLSLLNEQLQKMYASGQRRSRKVIHKRGRISNCILLAKAS